MAFSFWWWRCDGEVGFVAEEPRGSWARGWDDAGTTRRRRSSDLQHASEASHVDQVCGEGLRAGLVESLVAIALREAEELVDATHARPWQRHVEQRFREATDVRPARLRLREKVARIALTAR